jgi:hypothetical protein
VLPQPERKSLCMVAHRSLWGAFPGFGRDLGRALSWNGLESAVRSQEAEAPERVSQGRMGSFSRGIIAAFCLGWPRKWLRFAILRLRAILLIGNGTLETRHRADHLP